jgi:peptide/nickel transport system ATP-binding protein
VPQALLEIDDLSIALPRGADRELAVEALSFSLIGREILCLVGESGSGKSLAAQAIMGLLPGGGVKIVKGSIRFESVDLTRLPEPEARALRGARIAMIFQEPMTALNPVMKVGQQVAEVFRFHAQRSRIEERVVEMLAAVGLPEPKLIKDAYPFRLSGGQRQRVMIAMALALGPSVLIADEPTTALDVITQRQILELIRNLQLERQMACLFITHDFGVVAEIADRVAVMQEGRLVEIGHAGDVLAHPRHPYTKRLLAAVPRLEPPAAAPPRSAPALIQAHGIAKSFAGARRARRTVAAVKDASFAIHMGETLAVVGQSGAGKSTLARCIVRLIEPDAGRIVLRGVDGDLLALPQPALRRERRRVQMVFQDPYASLNPRRKVRDIIAMGPIAHGEPAEQALGRVGDLLRLVHLDASAADRYPHEFSGGQRQRIGIARALALEPELLIADEPVSALDVSIQAQVLSLLGEIRDRLGLAILLITHDLRVAAQIADRVAVMHEGRIVEMGAAGQVLVAPHHPYTRQLIEAVPGRRWLAPSDPSA